MFSSFGRRVLWGRVVGDVGKEGLVAFFFLRCFSLCEGLQGRAKGEFFFLEAGGFSGFFLGVLLCCCCRFLGFLCSFFLEPGGGPLRFFSDYHGRTTLRFPHPPGHTLVFFSSSPRAITTPPLALFGWHRAIPPSR